jgi:hypothetical protein
MKKIHFKTKLILNTQTIRRLGPTGLQGVQGGRPIDDSILRCVTDLCTELCTANCTVGCRVCG